MTHEEIIAQAKVGGFVTVRAVITNIDEDDVELPLELSGEYWVVPDDIIAIEPPPETDAEKIARLEARVRELEALAIRIGTGPFPRREP